jgi:hypothetical protein
MDVVEKARSYLEATRRAPRMFASTREAMMCHVTSVVYVLSDLNVQDFWKKHLGTYGNTYMLDEPVTDDWTRILIDDALRIIGGEKQ